jgi:cytoskeleton protein RodZ
MPFSKSTPISGFELTLRAEQRYISFDIDARRSRPFANARIMAQTLGEKLREAREARGMSLSEVADQTRISPHYIEAIERDDYKPLPGGIFNKGFIKSFAKYVGIDENEALADYLHAIAGDSASVPEEPRTYKPEVLTDSSSRSSAPTVLIAVLILGGMTAAILFGLNYLYQEPAAPVGSSNTNVSASPSANVAIPEATPTPESGVPDLTASKVEFKAVGQPVYLTATSDGRVTSNVVAAGATSTFEPKESLKLSYSKSLAKAVALTINGKEIALPDQPLDPKRAVIEFEINKSNFSSIWSNGSIVGRTAAVATPATTSAPPAASPENTAPPTNPSSSPRATPPPRAATTPGPAANTRATPRATPVIRPTVIIIPSANRPRRN